MRQPLPVHISGTLSSKALTVMRNSTKMLSIFILSGFQTLGREQGYFCWLALREKNVITVQT
jgi:hypothetical protein